MSSASEETSSQLSLEGLTIRVQDVERSLEFYCKLPGVQVIVHREGFFAMIRIGNGRLGLLQQSAAAPFHLEFETKEDLDTLSQQLKEAGVEHVKKPSQKAWGEVDFTVRDPDGNILEFETTEQ